MSGFEVDVEGLFSVWKGKKCLILSLHMASSYRKDLHLNIFISSPLPCSLDLVVL